MSIPKFSVEQPVLVNLLVLLVLVGGFVSYRQLPQEAFPDVSMEMITVVTTMTGASPREMEELVTMPLEEEIAKVSEIDEMTSTSSNGSSMIMIQFETSVDNIFDKLTEIQNQIEMVRGELPGEADDPVVREMKFPRDAVTVCLVGNAPEREVRDFAEQLKDDLKALPDVEDVDIAGLREREIWVECDPHRLHSYGLSLADVSLALGLTNLNLPGGLIKMGRGEFSIRTEAEFKNVGEVLDTILRDDGENGYVYLRDVATVEDTFEERRTLARIDGQPSINMTVKGVKKANTSDVVQGARDVVKNHERFLPAGMSMRLVNDMAIEVDNRLSALYNNFLLGLLLVIGTFTLFIGWRAALMVAAGLPVAYLATFIFLNGADYTLNMMTLFGLILVLGLLVDDAIVVCENVYRHMEAGMPLKEAAIKGTEEIMMPVVATVLTTVAAFLPLLLMTGIMGKFFSILPVVVTLALAASLFECLFVLPSHIAEFGGSSSKKEVHRARPWVVALSEVYEKVIRVLLRGRYAVIALTLATAFFTARLAMTGMEFILFGGRDIMTFSMAMEGPSTASLDETRRILDQLEARSLAKAASSPEIDNIRTRGGNISRMHMPGINASNVGQLAFELVPLDERDRLGKSVMDEVREIVQDVAGATITFEETREGPPVGKAIHLRLRGDNLDTLKIISGEVKAYLSSIDGVKDIMDNFPTGKDEVRPLLDLEKLSSVGLDVRTVASEIRGAFDGLKATTVHDGDEEIDVIVKYNKENRRSLTNLSDMSFSTPNGMVPFGNIGRVERREGVAQISHFDRKRTISIMGEVVEGTITSQAANQKVMAQFADLGERYPGYAIDFGGEFADTEESIASMIRAFFIAIVLIYVILGTLFRSYVLQPLVVLFSVPFSFIGVIFGFYIMKEPLGMMAIIGVIALAGIVVNDSLILLDFINTRRRMGVGRRDSISQAGKARLRPIILTSVTTIAGLMPLALGLFGVDQFLKPMAMSIAWGLLFATVLTLIVVPCVYSIADDISMLVTRHPLGLTGEEYREIKRRQEAELESAPEPA